MDSSTLRTALLFVLISTAFGLTFRKEIEQAIRSRPIGASAISHTTIPPDQRDLRPVYDRLKIAPLPDNLASDATVAAALKD